MLNALGRILNSLRGSATATAENIADSVAIPALEQNIRDADTKIDVAKRDLAGLMGKIAVGQRRLGELDQKIARDEAVVQRALDEGKEDLALEVANRLTTIQQEAETERRSIAAMQSNSEQLQGVVGSLTDQVKSLRREIDQIRVTESVQKAQSVILASGAGATGSINNAADALRRIKEKQAERGATFEAQQKLAEISTGGDLDRRLASEGLLEGPSSGKALIAKMKAERAALAAPVEQKALPAPEADKA